MPQATTQELELQYHQIADLYDLAEDLVLTVEDASVKDPEQQLKLVESLVEQVGDSADILCEEFIEVAGKSQKNAVKKSRIEAALRKIYIAIDAYNDKVAAMAVASEGLRNVADAIVEKIKRQVETVIAIMIDYIDLALDRIMNKHHIEALRQRQEKIAQMLYATERQQGFELGA